MKGKSFSVISLNNDDNAPFVIQIDEEPWTVVLNIDLEDDASETLKLGQSYNICKAGQEFLREGKGQPFEIRVSGTSQSLKDGIPAVQVSEIKGSVDHMIDLDGADWAPINIGLYKQRKITSWPRTLTVPTALASDRKYFIYNPWLVLAENTLKNPAVDGGGLAVVETEGQMCCANAPCTFINEDHYVLSYAKTACSADVPMSITIQLDSDTIQQIDDIGGESGATNIYTFVDILITEEIEGLDSRGHPVYYIGSFACNQ